MMEEICDCDSEIMFSSIEDEKGFKVCRATCPNCGQVWVLRLTKGKKIEVDVKI